mgnify:CR=1 FL=1
MATSSTLEFLNIKFRDTVLRRDVYDMSDARIERFYSKNSNFTSILELRTIHPDKTVRYKVNNFVKDDLRNYFNLKDMYIEMFVLEWCRIKTLKNIPI